MQIAAKTEAIEKVRAIMDEHGLTLADVSGRQPKAARAESPAKRAVAIKYRDKDGNTWTGRGLKPKWLSAALAAGKKIEDFAV